VICVHRTSDRTVAHLLRGALEAEGVVALVQGEQLFGLQGEVPAGPALELRVCILDDEQLPKAERVVREWLAARARPSDEAPWRCAGCGEQHEPQFATCWRCGGEKPAPA
jgi:hypothetical protein